MNKSFADVRDKIVSTERLKTNFKDLSGTTHGILKVLSYEGYYFSSTGKRVSIYKCECQRCKNICYLGYRSLIRNPKNCTTHMCSDPKRIINHVSTPEYNAYRSLKSYVRKYDYSICDEWRDSSYGFENFYKWLCDNGWKRNLTRLHIIDHNKKTISPDNIEIINNYDFTYKTEGYIVIKDYAFSINEWAKIANLTKGCINTRINTKGWDIRFAILIPKMRHSSDPVPDPRDVDELVTPEWKEKNHYQFFKELGLIKE